MNTTQLECFLTVANYLNFSRAAEHLRITQPAVSHQISALEDELETKLFHRTSKSVRLTREGYLFIQYAGEILKLTDRSKSRLKEFREGQPEHLRIGCRNTMELSLIQPVLTTLCRTAPDLIPVLRLIPSDSLENMLQDGSIQVMFSFRDSAPKKAVYRELTRCPVVCLCRRDHPLAAEKQVTVQQLQNAGRMAICRPPACPPDLFSIQRKIFTEHDPNQMLFCDNLEILYTLTASGFAFAVATQLPGFENPDLTCIPISGFSPLSFGVVYSSGRHTPLFRKFLSLLSEIPDNISLTSPFSSDTEKAAPDSR